MKKFKKTSRTLLASVLSMILCITMLLGTTLAWFTSSVTNENNRIVAGNLQVQLLKGVAVDQDYADISNGSGDIFTDEGENAVFWKPDMTQVVYLQVKNAGNLPLTYKVLLDITADAVGEGSVADVFAYAIVPGVEYGALDNVTWSNILKADGVETANVPVGTGIVAAPNGALEVNEGDYFALAVHMDKKAGNEFMNKVIAFDVKVDAKQVKEAFEAVPEEEVLAAAEAWKNKLAEEKANSLNQNLLADNVRYTYRERVEGTVENYVTNGTFDADIKGWSPNANTQPLVSWDPVGADETGGSLKIEGIKPLEDNKWFQPAINQVIAGSVVPGGATLQFSMDYKFEAGAELSEALVNPINGKGGYGSEVPMTSIGYYTPQMVNGVLTDKWLKQDNGRPPFSTVVADGEWHKFSYAVETPADMTRIEYFLRTNYSSHTMWIDNVELYVIKLPAAIALDDNMVFFYTDMEEITLTGTVDTAKYTDMSKAEAKFSVFDGQTLVWESDKVELNADGVATVNVPTSKLSETDTPYTVVATLIYDGQAAGEDMHDIFMFERPEAINEDGTYTSDFSPVFGYHVYRKDADEQLALFQKAKEAGLTVLQVSNAITLEEMISSLDMLEECGMKGMVCLYKAGKPAGHDDNIKTTIEIVKATKDHPALFGYNIVDEPSSDAGLRFSVESMINSYRLIRQYDTKSPIMFCECEEKYLDLTSCFADMIILDPYYDAKGAEVYTSVELAMSNLNFKKPVFTLTQSFVNIIEDPSGTFVTPDDIRNNNYQALIAGSGLGYFSIGDAGNVEATKLENTAWADLTWPSGDGYIPVWEVKAPGNDKAGEQAWAAMSAFAEKEMKVVYDHFVFEKGQMLKKDINIEGGYMYYAWKDAAGKAYLVVLDVLGGDVNVNIAIDGYSTATIVAGRDSSDAYTLGTELALKGVEAILFELK